MIHPTAATGFARAAGAYDRARPEYPAGAIAWAAGRLGLGPASVVVDLAAGTGKLTRGLTDLGFEVVAVEPVDEMRAALERAAPDARAVAGTAEAIPLPDDSADAVTVGQAFHWFDGPRALAEIDRVLRPGGALALFWNRRDMGSPVHRAVSEIIEPHHRDEPRHRANAWRASFAGEELEEAEFAFAVTQDADALVDRVASTSFVANLPDAERARVLGRVREIAAAGPVRVPYVCEVQISRRGGA
jgi:SAM-dependent methyltransferase